MQQRTLIILAVLATSLLLRADSCTLEERNVAVVLGGELPMQFESVGFTQASGEDTGSYDFGADLLDALDELELDGEIDQIAISGAGFEILRSEGHDAARSGEVFFSYSYDDGAGSISTGTEQRLLSWSTPTNAAGTKGYAIASASGASGPYVLFDPTGLEALNLLLARYLADYNAGNRPTLSVQGRATWNSTPPPTPEVPDDLSWEIFLQVQIRQNAQVEIFNL